MSKNRWQHITKIRQKKIYRKIVTKKKQAKIQGKNSKIVKKNKQKLPNNRNKKTKNVGKSLKKT